MALPQSRRSLAFAPAVSVLPARDQRCQTLHPNGRRHIPRHFSARPVCTAVAGSLWHVHKVSNSCVNAAARSDNPCHAVVVGAGLAGLITALELVEQGFTVDIYEARPFAGGKVGSWVDRDGNHIEMGLHVFFGCYYNLFDVMARVGAFKHLLLKEHRHQFVNIGGKLAELDFRLGAVGAPWNGLKAFATTHQLGVVDRIRNAIALGSSVIVKGLLDLDGALKEIRALDNVSFSEWFLSKGGTRASIERLWNPVAFALGFIDCDNISARCMLTIFQLFAARSEASVLRMLEGSSGEYLIAPIVKYIEQRGAKLHLRRKVRALNYDDLHGELRVTSLDIANGTETERVTGDAYIVACDVPGVQKLIPHEWRLRHKQLDRLFSLKAVPVVTVQLRFDGWVTELSGGTVQSQPTPAPNSKSAPAPARGIDNLLYTADAEFSCFADLAVTSPTHYYREGEGSLLQLVLTPGDPHIARSNEEIVERTLKQVKKLFPSAEKLVCTWSSVVKLAQSLYREEPGQDVNRPAQRTPVQNFFLAGSYTYQDYIDSMEGACKSGRLAAAAVLSALQERTPSS